MAERVDLGFKMEVAADGSGTDFEVRGAGIGGGAWFGFIFFGAFIGLPITFLVNMDARTGGPVLATWLIVVGLFTGIAFLMNSSRSQLYRFNVSKDAVRIEGKSYSKDDISEILVRNSAGKTATNVNVDGGTVVFGTGITGAAFVGATVLGNSAKKIGASTGQAIQESMAKRGNAVCIRHGRKVVPLAQNLQEDDAVALFNQLAKVM